MLYDINRQIALEDLNHEKLQMAYFAIKSLSLLMCPKEFLKSVVDEGSSVAKLTKYLDDKYACETIAVIFHAAANDTSENWIQRKILGPLSGQLIIKDLIGQVGHFSCEVRFWVLNCLVQIFPKNEVINQMLMAESTEPSLQQFRERGKFLTNLSSDTPTILSCKDEELKTGIFR